MTSLAAAEDRSPVLSSVIVLWADVLGYAAFVVHTVLSRRRYGPFFAEKVYEDPPWAARLLVETPAPLYAGAFLLLALGLLVKELAIERKDVTLRVNVLALAGLALLWFAWITMVSGPCEALERGTP